ncbi:alanine--tRNA ligase, mitochondrial-like [Ostrinia nubilalis]|uniref:alanine--tRNA ligase, mitochondrial-like n=1 Tax=Ostrinia nubilalis TaxID=29057 RepID=UPI0030824FF1
MLRIPVRGRTIHQNIRLKSTNSSNFIRSTFIEYFVEGHGHKHVKSSPVVPLCDSTVPFVNAGMNQFKGVFLGQVEPPCARAVNSQKCVRVGGKHNDLDAVGTDGHHHTFFEMLGNWSFGDYYKKEACQMAWDLLLGPYRLKPENLVVTYFAGDVVIGLPEDRECRDIWRAIGVPDSRLKALDAKDNFWEMGATGPCGPCTEIHHVNPDGSLTEIWNLVFIQCNREENGSVTPLRRQHVDTGLGLERLAALLQGARSNYDTDLFRPLITAVQQHSKGVAPYARFSARARHIRQGLTYERTLTHARHSKGVAPYAGSFDAGAALDAAYRRLADHARMISVCLADGVFPASSLNLKQIMRKSFKMSSDIFQNPHLLSLLYQEVANTLGETYPELVAKSKEAKLIIEHEEQAYAKMRAGLAKKWKDLAKRYPEVEELGDVEMASFATGYKEFKEGMAKQKSTTIPGELVFKLYDTYGFQEDMIERIATLNHLDIDKKGFWKLLSEHKSRHKTAMKEQSSNRALLFDSAVEKIIKSGVKSTNDQHKYAYTPVGNKIQFKSLKTKLVAILNEDCEWIDFLDPCEDRPYYLVAEDSNFYCEEGGQTADSGTIKVNNNVTFKVDTVFKIRDFVFHKGYFKVNKGSDKNYVNYNSEVVSEIDECKRVNVMRNHTGVHLLNAAIRQVLPKSVVCPTGSRVSDKGLSLNLSVYGEKLSQKVVLDAQELIRETIKCNTPVSTRVVDSLAVSREGDVVTIPGETYPEVGLRMVAVAPPPLLSNLAVSRKRGVVTVPGETYEVGLRMVAVAPPPLLSM